METMREPPALVLQNVRKTFGAQKVLDGFTLQVSQDETVAVLGRSGAGKSVLLKLIIGLQKPDAGSIQVHGEDIARLPADRLNQIRLKVGFLFQEAALYDSLSIEENVAFPLRRHRTISEAEQKTRVRKLLSDVGMKDDDLDKMPSQISGGMKKRVGLARALALEPDILLFDEPTSGLDPITAGEIEALIVSLKKERHIASVVVTHDLRGAATLADRLALIREGNIAIEGTFDDLKRSTDTFVSQFLRHAC